jgi:hypothetical protein
MLSSEWMLLEDYDYKGWATKIKTSGRELQKAWHQNGLVTNRQV